MATLHHYIPALRIADTVYGLYDLISGNFYDNDGTGDFTGGNNASGHSLPPEYQELDYIASSGTQYINTGYYPMQDTVTSCTFEVVNFIGSAYNALYGCQGTSMQPSPWHGIDIRHESSDRWSMLYRYGNRSDYVHNTPSIATGVHTAEQDHGKNILDDTQLSEYQNVNPFTLTYPMYLFAENKGDQSISTYSAIKMYEMIIAEEEITPPTPPTPGTMNLYYNGNGVDDLYYNGQHVDHLVYNGNPVE